MTRYPNYTPASTTNYADWGIDNDGNGFNIWKPFYSPNQGNFKFFIKEDGKVGINTGNPQQQLDVNGKVRAVQYLLTSDERYKSNIRPLENSMKRIMELNPVNYTFTQPINDQTSSFKEFPKQEQKILVYNNQTGLIAQDVQKIFPELVASDEKGYLSIDYIGLIPHLIQALQNQNQQIEQLKEQLNICCAIDNSGMRIKETDNLPFLEQNSPNPFSSKTSIKYYIPVECTESKIAIYALDGREIISFSLANKGYNSIDVEANTLQAGIYLYTLICDGKEVATKRMILTSK